MQQAAADEKLTGIIIIDAGAVAAAGVDASGAGPPRVVKIVKSRSAVAAMTPKNVMIVRVSERGTTESAVGITGAVKREAVIDATATRCPPRVVGISKSSETSRRIRTVVIRTGVVVIGVAAAVTARAVTVAVNAAEISHRRCRPPRRYHR
jgi:hypothetical protein